MCGSARPPACPRGRYNHTPTRGNTQLLAATAEPLDDGALYARRRKLLGHCGEVVEVAAVGDPVHTCHQICYCWLPLPPQTWWLYCCCCCCCCRDHNDVATPVGGNDRAACTASSGE